MLQLDGKKVEIVRFPDKTLLLRQEELPAESSVTIKWTYEDDSELFALFCLKRKLDEWHCKTYLSMPYVPNARMDRAPRPQDIFTLKYFAEIINSLEFENVIVFDPHSNVSEALINRAIILRPQEYIQKAIAAIGDDDLVIFYPDEGAMKRYSGMIKKPYAFGVKIRNWENGAIESLDIIDKKDLIKDHNILIVDDICSKGGTFYYSAKALKAAGAATIYLYVSHCEDTILEGTMIGSGLIEKVFTTDSILSVTHERIQVIE